VRDAEFFVEVEAILYLYTMLESDPNLHLARDAWALVSGYIIPGVNDSLQARQYCARLRARLRYLRQNTGWQRWQAWYAEQPPPMRLFSFHRREDGQDTVKVNLHDCLLYQERKTLYETLCTDTHFEPVSTFPPRPFAPPGRYTFMTRDEQHYEIMLTEAFAQMSRTPMTTLPPKPYKQRDPVCITLHQLAETARWLDAFEAENTMRRNDWERRLSRLKLKLFDADGLLLDSDTLNIDRLFHLVGILGVGKSTLIWLITVHLARDRGMHVTVVLHTIVETMERAEWLNRLGIPTTPALGQQRESHAAKYAAVTHEIYPAEQVLNPDTPAAPVFAWLPTVCALSGSTSDGIPIGNEPCYSLIGEDGERYRCPLLPVCPVHAVRRELVDSQIWLVNPASMVHSRALDDTNGMPVSLLDAVYHYSDLVIVDEADRVQMIWDAAFAPETSLAGGDDSLLDKVHVEISRVSVGRAGRRNSVNASFNRLIGVDGQAHTLSHHLFRLVQKIPDLGKWAAQIHWTNPALFEQVEEALIGASGKQVDKDVLRARLHTWFDPYWRRSKQPPDRAVTALHAYVNQILVSSQPEKRVRALLIQWSNNYLEWDEPLSEKQTFALRKLDFALVMAALLRRVKDVYYLLPAFTDMMSIDKPFRLHLSDAITRLVPDPPLGLQLGVRLSQYEAGVSSGVFTELHYSGVGRWLLENFASLYVNLTGIEGAPVLLTSATSWLPDAASFHISALPHAVLLPSRETNQHLTVRFKPVVEGRYALSVSGAGEQRERNLRRIVQALATQQPGSATPSDLRAELLHWERMGKRRRILLVVSSYEQSKWVEDTLNRIPEWRGRVRRLRPDSSQDVDHTGTLRASEVESYLRHDADILVAPMMTIQRGHNILDNEDKALLGSVFFLVRPYPPSEDMTPNLLGMNAWAIEQLEHGSTLKAEYRSYGIGAVKILRRRARAVWHKRVSRGHWGVASLHHDAYTQYVGDQFVAVWQTIGRLLRGEMDARVFFVDAAYAPDTGPSLLRSWRDLLNRLFDAADPRARALAHALYKVACNAFNEADIPSGSGKK
jgi:hypothetical protein